MFFKSPAHPNLYTERLLLRAPSFLDVEDLFDFCSDPDSCRYADWMPHRNQNETREYVSWLKRKSNERSFTWVIEHRLTRVVIGTISVVEVDYSGKIITVGYTLSKKYQHQGYATEALTKLVWYLLNDLKAERIQAKVIPENTPSCRLLERVGFKNEGLLKKGAFCRTNCVDIFLYSFVK